MRTLIAIVPMALTLALAACGGGGSEAPVSLEVTPEASASPAGLVAYVTALSAIDTEQHEPVGIGAFNPQLPDDTEPQPLN